MKRSLLAGALVLAAGGQALASDAAAPPPRAPAAYVPPVSSVGTSNWTDPNNVSKLGSTGDFSTTGFLVGPTVGVNFQTDEFVYGIEADFDGSWIDGKSSSRFCVLVGFGAGAQCETKSFWFSTARARLGYRPIACCSMAPPDSPMSRPALTAASSKAPKPAGLLAPASKRRLART